MNSSRERPACSNIARSVPFGRDLLSGIITNLVSVAVRFTMAEWLPLPLLGASSNPATLRAVITRFDEMMGSFLIARWLPNEL